MKRHHFPCIALLLLTPLSHAESDVNANAALRYWQAFSAIPEFSDEQNEALAEWRTIALDDERVTQTIALSKPALEQLHSAAKIDTCDWGLDMSQGFALPLPHLSKSRELMRMACLRARAHLAAGRTDAGLTDLDAAAKLANDTGQPALLICQLVAVAQQSMVRDCLADHAHRLTAAQRTALIARLPELLATPKLSDGLSAERDVAVPWLRDLSNNPAKLMQAIQGGEAPDGAPDLPDGNDGVKMMRKQIDFLEEDFNAIIKVADGPLDEIEKVTDTVVARAENESRILTAVVLPAGSAVARNFRIATVQAAMLHTALLILNDQADAAEKIADPYGDGPFAVTVVGDTITLKSKLNDRQGKPVELKVKRK